MDVPAKTPERIPLPEPIVATVVVLLTHVPPVKPSLSVVVAPVQTVDDPAIVAGNGLTVTIAVFIQPVAVNA